MYEVLDYYKKQIDSSSVLKKLNLIDYKYFVVSAHREENIDNESSFLKLIDILNAISEKYKYPVIVSTHPRTKIKFDSMNVNLNKGIKLIKPLGFTDYNKLQIMSKVVLSDSGTISEESSILNFPALNIREAHERPEAMEEGSVMMTGLNVENVMHSIEILKNQERGSSRSLNIVNDYNVKNVSEKVLRIIHSYTDYINRVVWKKY